MSGIRWQCRVKPHKKQHLSPPEKWRKHFGIWRNQVVFLLPNIHKIQCPTSCLSHLDPAYLRIPPDPSTILHPCPTPNAFEWDTKVTWRPASKNPSYPPDDQATFSQPGFRSSLRGECYLFFLFKYENKTNKQKNNLSWVKKTTPSNTFTKSIHGLFSPFSNKTLLPLLLTINPA